VTALQVDLYELTMLQAALVDGSAHRRCVFEVFTRRLSRGRRFGIVAGVDRLLDELEERRFTGEQVAWLRQHTRLSPQTCAWLADHRFTGDITGYVEGEAYFPNSPVLRVEGTFAECTLLETLVLGMLNHDSAVASAAVRMVIAAGDRPCIEMGSRRTHEDSAMASARAAYVAGFASTSNVAAGKVYGIPVAGTAAHSWTMLHDTEAQAFASQVAAFGAETTLLVDTYDISRGVRTAIEVAGTGLAAVRIDSGDLAVLARQTREQLDSLGATTTRIVLSGDLDEFAVAALAAAPVDAYGIGTAVVAGSGVPSAGFVYKLVEVDGHPVEKRSEDKQSTGGRKDVVRRHRPSGTATEECVSIGGPPAAEPGDRHVQVPLVRAGQRVHRATVTETREHVRSVLGSLPWQGLALSGGDPAIPTTLHRA
jgi:nicotinate phosphoribosyltransferase